MKTLSIIVAAVAALATFWLVYKKTGGNCLP
jgi:hypothetical protein